MATRRRIPMVGDGPSPVPESQVKVLLDQPKLEVTLAVRTEVSPYDKEFDWDAWSGLLMAALIIPRSTDHLMDYWKANANLLDYAQKTKPDVFTRIRAAFTARKLELQGGQDG